VARTSNVRPNEGFEGGEAPSSPRAWRRPT